MISLLVLLLAQPVPEDSILKLFDQVAHPYLKYQDLKEPSREALVELGSEAARVLMTKMRSRNARELHGLEDVLEDIGEAALPHLHEATGDTCGRARRLAVRILGKIGSPASIPHILPFLDDTSWKARSVAEASRITCISLKGLPGSRGMTIQSRSMCSREKSWWRIAGTGTFVSPSSCSWMAGSRRIMRNS
jgi:hypothetical protein